MKKPTCETCFNSRPLNDEAISCQAHPPAVFDVVGNRVTSHWPLLSKDQWCGEWKPKTTAVLKSVDHKAQPKMGRTIPSGDAA